MRILPFAIIAAALLPAAPAMAQAADATTYVNQSNSSDLFETRSSKAILSWTGDEKIRQFAEQMKVEHTQSTQAVAAAARADGVTFRQPAFLIPAHKDLIAKLNAAPAADKPATYVQVQIQAYEQALALPQGDAQSGDKEHLKAEAARLASVVQGHLDMLKTIVPAGAPAGGM